MTGRAETGPSCHDRSTMDVLARTVNERDVEPQKTVSRSSRRIRPFRRGAGQPHLPDDVG